MHAIQGPTVSAPINVLTLETCLNYLVSFKVVLTPTPQVCRWLGTMFSPLFLPFLFTKLPNVYYRPTILTKEKGGNYKQRWGGGRERQNWLKQLRVYYIDRRTNKPSWLSFSHLIMIVLPLSSPIYPPFSGNCCTVLCFCVYVH